jgi:hypothetical protein
LFEKGANVRLISLLGIVPERRETGCPNSIIRIDTTPHQLGQVAKRWHKGISILQKEPV